MNQRTISCVVEGHGEVEAVPALLRAVASVAFPTISLQVPRPIRVPKGTLVRAGELEKAVKFAILRLGGPGSVLVLLDADDDCPAREGAALLERAKSVAGTTVVSVVLAKSEFESWFLAAADSLRGLRGLRDDLVPPSAPENIRGAKEWLTRQMSGTKAYSETLDQAALASRMDIAVARTAPSFDKFYRDVVRMVGTAEDRSR